MQTVSQKKYHALEALLKLHQNDALLMHVHMVLMHLWCVFKGASKAHQKCINSVIIFGHF